MGGIDLCHGRRDDEHHLGDLQALMDERYGDRPPWYRRAATSAAWPSATCRSPGNGGGPDPAGPPQPVAGPVDQGGSASRASPARAAADAARPGPPPAPTPSRCCAPTSAKRPALPFAPSGERSIARAYLKALWRARRLIYLEDQYLWSEDVACALVDALRRSPDLRLIAVALATPTRTGA